MTEEKKKATKYSFKKCFKNANEARQLSQSHRNPLENYGLSLHRNHLQVHAGQEGDWSVIFSFDKFMLAVTSF